MILFEEVWTKRRNLFQALFYLYVCNLCVFSFQNGFQRISSTQCIWMVCSLCGSSYVYPDARPEENLCHKRYIGMVSPSCGSWRAFSSGLEHEIFSGTGDIHTLVVFLHKAFLKRNQNGCFKSNSLVLLKTSMLRFVNLLEFSWDFQVSTINRVLSLVNIMFNVVTFWHT